MRIEPASREDVAFVALNMRDRDFEEFSAMSRFDTREQLAEALANSYGGRDDVLCATLDEPVCIGMTIEAWPNVVTLGFMATDRFPEIGLGITKFTKDLLSRFEAAGAHRIQAISIDGYDAAHRWLQTLGLQREFVLRGYGRKGEDFVQFSRCKDASSPGA